MSSRQRDKKPQRKNAGGRKREQHPDHPQPKPPPVQSTVGSRHQELDFTATNKYARTDHQPSQIFVCDESVIIRSLHSLFFLFFLLLRAKYLPGDCVMRKHSITISCTASIIVMYVASDIHTDTYTKNRLKLPHGVLRSNLTLLSCTYFLSCFHCSVL